MVTWLSILRTLLKPFYLIGVLGALLLIGMGVFVLVSDWQPLIGIHLTARETALVWSWLFTGVFILFVSLFILVRVVRHAKRTLQERQAARIPSVQ